MNIIHRFANYKLVIHFGGSSYMKGTLSVLKFWSRRLSNIDEKLIFTHDPKFDYVTAKFWKSLRPTNEHTCAGISVKCQRHKNMYYIKHMDKKTYDHFSKCAGIRLQPSIIEGYGHVLGEAGGGTVTLTTDAAPMNELIVDPRCLIPVGKTTPCHMIFKNFKNRFKWMYKAECVANYITENGFVNVLSNIFDMSLSDKLNIAAEQSAHKSTSDIEFKNNIDIIFT